MKQLLMRWTNTPVPERKLKAGFRYEGFTGTQDEIDDWTNICLNGLLPDNQPHWFVDCMLNHPNLVPQKDIFFAVRESDGKRVATCAAVTESNGEGYLHMLGTLPEARGNGLGYCMIAHALEMLAERGCTTATLTTDDFRLAAIKTYLDIGLLPVICEDPESDMHDRWDKVIEQLNYPHTIEYIDE